ncbi:hypothetical protein ASPZODRAFT_145820 [Penicilliopsis zonata CBS 506.65]|uniref:GH64 domain-containing protein n=1 Tax=Penicilliopsis zonata CBS 506.65 TaxID=1073090 RepID=A0A1L9S9Q7_9EURO|nr:hypothetical protein ASPZODRAFT_145820 [Penicilliopsis zonata CBS 506.65]OJJ43886.1 hypothetical protein ASPZODRAFT_145820 [Penicilliopsis zonata CBS 506.65]
MSLSIEIQNTTGGVLYAYVTGTTTADALFLLQSNGTTAYYPTSPSTTLSALAVDCAIAVSSAGTTSLTVPYLSGARLWFSRGSQPLTFYLNPGPALVEPSVSNTSDVNYEIAWDFCEFTFTSTELYANITYVDFVCLPIALSLTDTQGATQTVSGMPADGLQTVCDALQAQNETDGAGWDQLVITSSSTGAYLRAVSPNTGIAMDDTLFDGYYDTYVTEVWDMYTDTELTVDTQISYGDVTGKVVEDDEDDDEDEEQVLTFTDGVAIYTTPASADIFSCSSGPFTPSGTTEKDDITARLAAAFNRSTLLIDSNQPEGEVVSTYYQADITNHYARICHATDLDGEGYAFPYDDVGPTDGADISGSVVSSSPALWTVVVGG